MASLPSLLREIRACDVCAASLPAGPRPIVRAHEPARILIVGQAPGRRVHESGIPWDDPSGDRLRHWMGVSDEEFRDESNVAILPMGFCYPGTGKSGDLPPRPECADLWHAKLLDRLPNIELTLVVGQYAIRRYLERPGDTLTETVRAWREATPAHLPLPHPSPRNNLWLRRNPWFEAEVLPYLGRRVRKILRRAR